MLVHVAPSSVVLKTQVPKSSLRWPSKHTYAVPGACGDASTSLTHNLAGTSGIAPLTFSHVAPSFFVTQTLPSSVPAHSRPGTIGDSDNDTTVA